jgi:hypothetical protein
MSKLQSLMNLLEKEFKRKFKLSETINLDTEIKLDYVYKMKELFHFHEICIIEISSFLSGLGMGSLGIILSQLFKNFKQNMAYFLKFNIFFFKMKNFFPAKDKKNARDYKGLLKNMREKKNNIKSSFRSGKYIIGIWIFSRAFEFVKEVYYKKQFEEFLFIVRK